MIREFNLKPETLNAALRPIRAALAGIPGAAVEVLPTVRLTVREHVAVDGSFGRTEWRENARWGEDAVPVRVTIPDGAMALAGWELVCRRTDAGGAEAQEWWGQYRTDAALRDAARSAAPAELRTCQECGKGIRRTSTSIVREVSTGRYLQVGGTCEGRYVPATAIKILKALSVTTDHLVDDRYRDDDDECMGGRGFAPYLFAADFLAALGYLFANAPYVSSRDGYGERNLEATWRVAWQEVLDSGGPAAQTHWNPLPAGVVDALRANPETARYFEGDALVSRKDAAYLCGAARKAALDLDRGAAPQGTCPEGRLLVEGRLVSTKLVESPYGTVRKALVECGGGAYRVWGTVPARAEWTIGEPVRFTATLQRSQKDPAFGFYSRPSV